MLVATTQHPSAWSIAREKAQRDQQRNLILLADECLTYAREESGLSSVLQRAVYAAIQKIRLSVKTLELRLEDTETAPEHPFAIGVRASCLYNVECDCSWKSQESSSAECVRSTVASERGSSTADHAHQARLSHGWLRWMTSFRRRREKETSRSGGIPKCFHLKTVLQGAALYLDQLSGGQLNSPWLPHPASYRRKILSHLEQSLATKSFCANEEQPSLPIPLTAPPKMGGCGAAAAVSQRTLKQAVNGRKTSRSTVVLHKDYVPNADETRHTSGAHPKYCKGQFSPRRSEKDSNSCLRSGICPSGPVNLSPTQGADLNGDELKCAMGNDALIRFSDLYSPSEFWHLAKLTAAQHEYILKPTDVEIRARCVQRPTAPYPGTERTFTRPSSSSVCPGTQLAVATNELAHEEGEARLTTTKIKLDESLPALSISFVFRGVQLQLTAFQVASIFRWLHFGLFLYQEVVSGVYAECL